MKNNKKLKNYKNKDKNNDNNYLLNYLNKNNFITQLKIFIERHILSFNKIYLNPHLKEMIALFLNKDC